MEAPSQQPQKCGSCRLDKPLGDYSPSYRGKVGTWCRPCFAAYHRGERVKVAHEQRRCRACDGTYVPLQLKSAAAYCSRDCKVRARKVADIAARVASKTARSCLWCGGHIGPERRRDAAYCSAICNAKAHSRTRNYHRRAGTRTRPRRTPLVSLVTIARLSCWRCGICGKRVRPSLAHPAPMAPSLDHIVPLSRGGREDDANLQLAHLVCNLRKRQVM